MTNLNRAIRLESLLKLVWCAFFAVTCPIIVCVCVFFLAATVYNFSTDTMLGAILSTSLAFIWVVFTMITSWLTYAFIRLIVMHALIIVSTYQHGAKQARTEHLAKCWQI